MAKLSPKNIVGIVIALLLVGILLPIGLDNVVDMEIDNKTRTTSLSNESIPYSANITLYEDQELNATVEYDDSTYHLNLSIFDPSGSRVENDSTENATLSVAYNATTYGVHTLNITNIGVSGPTANITYTITTFPDSDAKSNLETLGGEVIPIVAIIALVLAFVPIMNKYRN